MTTSAEIMEELRRDFEARYGTPRHELIEAGRVRDYLMAMNEPADLASGTPVPTLFLLTLGRMRRPRPSRGAAVNAGDDFEFLAPLYVGDVVTSCRRVLSVEEKQGKVGLMFLLKAETRFENQKGELIGRAFNNMLRWGL